MSHRLDRQRTRKEKAKKAELLTLSYRCPKSKKVMTVDASRLDDYLSVTVGPCDLCGEHTYMELRLPECTECGDRHEVVLRDN